MTSTCYDLVLSSLSLSSSTLRVDVSRNRLPKSRFGSERRAAVMRGEGRTGIIKSGEQAAMIHGEEQGAFIEDETPAGMVGRYDRPAGSE